MGHLFSVSNHYQYLALYLKKRYWETMGHERQFSSPVASPMPVEKHKHQRRTLTEQYPHDSAQSAREPRISYS